MDSRPHSSAGNKNKWAPASSVVESRNKARELSRALERAANDLKAIDRQFQLLDEGLLSEEDLQRFAGKSFFSKATTPKRFQYLDAAETRNKRQLHEEHVVSQQLLLTQRKKNNDSSPSIGSSSHQIRRSPHKQHRLKKMDSRPRSPYDTPSSLHTKNTSTESAGISNSHQPRGPSSVGSSRSLSDIRDDRVEEGLGPTQKIRSNNSHRSPTTKTRGRSSHPKQQQQQFNPTTMSPKRQRERQQQQEQIDLTNQRSERGFMKKEDTLAMNYRKKERARRRQLDQELFVFYASRFGPLDGVLYAQSSLPGILYEKVCTDATLSVQQWWKSIWPERAKRKHEAASFMQKILRGNLGRRHVLGEAKARKAMRHLFNQKAAIS